MLTHRDLLIPSVYTGSIVETENSNICVNRGSTVYSDTLTHKDWLILGVYTGSTVETENSNICVNK